MELAAFPFSSVCKLLRCLSLREESCLRPGKRSITPNEAVPDAAYKRTSVEKEQGDMWDTKKSGHGIIQIHLSESHELFGETN